jgi:Family of unknown function (DUF6326)
MKRTGAPSDDIKIHTKFKIAALWTSAMFCYIYNDYFYLYEPGKLQAMLNGKMEPLAAMTQGVLLGAAVTVAIPAIMIYLSLVLTSSVSRRLNIVLGLVYTLISLLTIYGSWAFYIFFAVIESALTLLIAWYAWRWPKGPGELDIRKSLSCR